MTAGPCVDWGHAEPGDAAWDVMLTGWCICAHVRVQSSMCALCGCACAGACAHLCVCGCVHMCECTLSEAARVRAYWACVYVHACTHVHRRLGAFVAQLGCLGGDLVGVEGQLHPSCFLS